MSLTHTQTSILIASLSGFIILAIFTTLILLRGRVPFTFSRSNPPSTHPTPMKNLRYRAWLGWYPPSSLTPSALESGEKKRTGGNSNSQANDEGEVVGEYEKYGELYVPPNKQPTIIALDIIMRCLLATGLSGRATVGDGSASVPAEVGNGGFEGASLMEKGLVVGPPKYSLELARPVTFLPSEYVEIMLSPIRTAGTSSGAQGKVGQLTSLRVDEVEQKRKGVDSVLDQSREDEHVADSTVVGFGRGKGMARMYR